MEAILNKELDKEINRLNKEDEWDNHNITYCELDKLVEKKE